HEDVRLNVGDVAEPPGEHVAEALRRPAAGERGEPREDGHDGEQSEGAAEPGRPSSVPAVSLTDGEAPAAEHACEEKRGNREHEPEEGLQTVLRCSGRDLDVDRI